MQLQINCFPQLLAHRNQNLAKLTVDLRELATLMRAVNSGNSLVNSSQSMGLSYRSVWNRVRDAENVLGIPLINRVKGHGSSLTPQGKHLLDVIDASDADLKKMASHLETKLIAGISNLSKADELSLKIYASNDPLLEEILEGLDKVEIRTMGSGQALDRLINRSCDLAGFHVPDEDNVELVRTRLSKEGLTAIPVMRRTQGLMIAKGNPLKIKKIQDLARPEVRFINRQKGAGTRLYFEQLLEKSGLEAKKIRGYTREEFTHSAVANAILVGAADVGMGLKNVALASGLDFLPMGDETYFLGMDANMAKRHLTKGLIKKIRDKAEKTPGYDKVQLRQR